MGFIGQFAAIATVFCWSANSVCFAIAGERVGSQTVNIARLYMALACMVLLHLLFLGTPFPASAGSGRFFWFGISGLIGFALGDAVLFESFIHLGPRLAMLVMTLWPVMASLMAGIFLGETLRIPQILAMLVTLGGIAWVVSEKGGDGVREGKPRRLGYGLLLALGGAVGQSTGFIFSKFGLAGDFHPISANLIRVLAGTIALSGWILLKGQMGSTLGNLRDRRSTALIAIGAALGPVIGVVLSLVAQKHANQGVAATLMSLSPVVLLPVSAIFFKEKITQRAVLGTLVTIGGAAALFLV